MILGKVNFWQRDAKRPYLGCGRNLARGNSLLGSM